MDSESDDSKREKRKAYMREYRIKYYKTEKGAEARAKSIAKWNKSENGLIAKREYQKTNEAYKKKQSARSAKFKLEKNRKLMKTAYNSGCAYTIKDDELILSGGDLTEVALSIGRSYNSVIIRRARVLGKA